MVYGYMDEENVVYHIGICLFSRKDEINKKVSQEKGKGLNMGERKIRSQQQEGTTSKEKKIQELQGKKRIITGTSRENTS